VPKPFRIKHGVIPMRSKFLAGSAVIALSLAFSGATFAAETKGSIKFSDDTYKYLELFGDVFERVRRDYVEEVSDQTLIENAINGMLTSLDPHSGYMPAKGFQDMQENTKGEFGGLGIEVTMENGVVKVVSPIDDTPASRAGVQPGDFIVAIDGKPTPGTLNEAVDQMRGPVNSSITLTLRRVGSEPIDVKLTRAVIRVKSVSARAEGEVGYIRIGQFTEQTQVGLDKAIKDLKTQIGTEKIKGYVVDLRNNPGGLLDQAVSVSDTFLDRGEIVSTRSRKAEDSR
jgi:carboxyl-terminal processing protease